MWCDCRCLVLNGKSVLPDKLRSVRARRGTIHSESVLSYMNVIYLMFAGGLYICGVVVR